MNELLVKPSGRQGPLHDISPADAGWRYVGFAVHEMADRECLSSKGTDDEICFVLLSGAARVIAGNSDFGLIESRSSVFEGRAPEAVYVPFRMSWSVKAEGPVELAICRAPGTTGQYPPRHISKANMLLEVRGTGTNVRHVCNILPETEPADSLLVVEVITPPGNWSSYPPHKHDEDNMPEESLLEETYYHRINPPQGYVLQRVYTDSRDLDETMAATDKSVVLVPRGYHPVGAPHGYESYYLNVMAGPRRVWKFKNDPAHEWIFNSAVVSE